jgi:hypothetical protein
VPSCLPLCTLSMQQPVEKVGNIKAMACEGNQHLLPWTIHWLKGSEHTMVNQLTHTGRRCRWASGHACRQDMSNTPLLLVPDQECKQTNITGANKLPLVRNIAIRSGNAFQHKIMDLKGPSSACPKFAEHATRIQQYLCLQIRCLWVEIWE